MKVRNKPLTAPRPIKRSDSLYILSLFLLSWEPLSTSDITQDEITTWIKHQQLFQMADCVCHKATCSYSYHSGSPCRTQSFEPPSCVCFFRFALKGLAAAFSLLSFFFCFFDGFFFVFCVCDPFEISNLFQSINQSLDSRDQTSLAVSS